MLGKFFLAMLTFVSMVELAGATETVGCGQAVVELVQRSESTAPCQSAADPTQVTGMKALYGDVDQADMLLMRINHQGAPVSMLVAIIVFLPGVAILFFSWLVKSNK